MKEETNKDAGLKKGVAEFLARCGLQKLVVDREVHLNFTGSKNAENKFEDEKEIDVVARFSYRGEEVLVFFECEDSTGAGGSPRAEFRDYANFIKKLSEGQHRVQIIHSRDGRLNNRH